MTTEAPTIRATTAARRIEAEWQTGPDTFCVLSAMHSTGSKALIATVRRERAGAEVGAVTSRTYAPFQDMQRIAVQRCARYSLRALEAFFTEQMFAVEATKGDPSTTVGELFANPTTA